MSGCDREQGTHYQCDCMRERMERLEAALLDIRNYSRCNLADSVATKRLWSVHKIAHAALSTTTEQKVH